jgi:hypothetical protein
VKSKHICARCGSPVIRWLDGWKHANGGNSDTRSCGKPPHVVERADYDADIDAIVDEMQRYRDAGAETARQRAYDEANARWPLPISGIRELT